MEIAIHVSKWGGGMPYLMIVQLEKFPWIKPSTLTQPTQSGNELAFSNQRWNLPSSFQPSPPTERYYSGECSPKEEGLDWLGLRYLIGLYLSPAPVFVFFLF